MKKGFTLVELLAVIVVLAILALIVTPIVMNVVETVKIESDERSVEQYAKVMQSTYYEMQVKDPTLTLEKFLNEVDAVSGVSLSYSGSKVVCSEKIATDAETIELRNCMVDGRGPYNFINGSVEKNDNTSNSSTKYTIVKKLTNVTISNNATRVKAGESYSVTLTPTTEYDLDTVTVTMGGTDITSSAYSEGEITIEKVTGDIKIVATAYKSFAEDSWSTIIANVKNGNASAYKVGDTKEITLTSTDSEIAGTYKVRIANTSTPEKCNTEGFSQTACGFVIEFVDIISKHNMNSKSTNVGGWPASEMRTYVNNDIYNALPEELKTKIIDTYTVSGYGQNDSPNKTSTDKLYLLSTSELWAGGESNDTARNLTRQLDYYEKLGVTTDNCSGAIKQYNGSNAYWWLRSAYFSLDDDFYRVLSDGNSEGDWYGIYAIADFGVSPAFRIG